MTGGKRDGAGRPPASPLLKKIPIGIKLPAWLVAWLRDPSHSESQAVLIEDALCYRFSLAPPNPPKEKS